MSNSAELFTTLPLAEAARLDGVCDAFEAAWRECLSAPPRLDDFLSPLPAELQSAALLELLPIELAYLHRRGAAIAAADYRRRYPAAEPYLQQWLEQRGESVPARQLASGEQFGKYTVVEWLGAGGMGDVYRAVDPVLRREVAIKILLRRFHSNSDALARIQVEAQLLAALNHPHIVTVHDFAMHEGIPYMALELLTGETLAERLRRGPLVPGEALRLATQLAQALAIAHHKQIVHRDLKPQNIFLTECGEPKILDFGLARLAQSPPEPANAPTAEHSIDQQTAAGARLGTTGYMSPEQVLGKPVDARSDVFSFGCVLYEMLAGVAPFKRPTRADTDRAILTEPVAWPPVLRNRLGHGLQQVVEHCLQKNASDRYESAGTMAEKLADLATRHAHRKDRLMRRLEHAALAVICSLLLALGALLWNQQQLTKRFNALAVEVGSLSLDHDLDRVQVKIREMNQVRDGLWTTPEALDLQIKGAIDSPERYACVVGYLRLERGTRTDIDKALRSFQQALDARPGYVPALVGLSECHYARSNAYASPLVEMPQVRDYAQQALDLGDKSGAAEVLLGIYEHRFNWKWAAAEPHFENALRAPGHSATALQMYGNALVLRKEFAAGITKLRDALKLDSDSLQLRTDLALAYLYWGKFPEARHELNSVLAADANFFPARWALGEWYLRQPNYPAAIRELREACRLDPDSVEAQAELAFCLRKSNTDRHRKEAQEIIERLKNPQPGVHVPPTALAVAHLGLGQTSAALANLERGRDQHDEWLVWLAVDPVFDELRLQTRFQVILAVVGDSP